MKTLTATEYMMQLLNDYQPPGQPFSPDEKRINWPFFLTLLEQFCTGRGWAVECYKATDMSCAIFARAEISVYQLSLFPDCPEVQSPPHGLMSGNGDDNRKEQNDG